MPRRTYLHTAEWKYRRTLVSLSASSRRRNRDAAPPQPRVDRRPTTRLHIRHQFYSLLTVSGHPCAGKLLNHPQIRTKALLVTAPLSIRASFLPCLFKYIFYFFYLSKHSRRGDCCYKQRKEEKNWGRKSKNCSYVGSQRDWNKKKKQHSQYRFENCSPPEAVTRLSLLDTMSILCIYCEHLLLCNVPRIRGQS